MMPVPNEFLKTLGWNKLDVSGKFKQILYGLQIRIRHPCVRGSPSSSMLSQTANNITGHYYQHWGEGP